MTETPQFEDAMTAGMNALADSITRSIDLVLPGGLLRLIGLNWSRLPSRAARNGDERRIPAARLQAGLRR